VDESWREAQKRWLESPDDQGLLERTIAAFRRAQLPLFDTRQSLKPFELLGDLWLEGKVWAGSALEDAIASRPLSERLSYPVARLLHDLFRRGKEESLDLWYEWVFPTVRSDGGPLILLPAHLLSHWEGVTNPDDPTDSDTDYGRACDAGGDVSLITVGPGQGLVLGHGRRSYAWWTSSKKGGILVRWIYADRGTDDVVVKALEDLPDSAFEPTDCTFSAESSRALIFDSAYSGTEASEMPKTSYLSLEIAIAPGEYRVETAHCEPNDHTALDLYRLSPR